MKVEMMVEKILFLGRIAVNKGIHNLIEAMPIILEKSPDAKLIISGRATEWGIEYSNYLDSLIEKLNLEEKVERMGIMTDTPSFYGTVDVVVCPSIAHEGFGIVPLEALKYNGIVVASDIFLDTEVVNKKVTFVYPRDDIEELAGSVIKALSLPEEEREALREKAEEWVSRFTWDKHVERLEEIFSEIVGERQSRANR